MSIINKDSNTLVSGTSGNDNIGNYGGSNVTIDGGSGKDTIANEEGKYVTINGGDGNDMIFNHYSDVMINGNTGDDLIYNGRGGTSRNVSIDSVEGKCVTINGGDGKDNIKNFGSYVIINGNEGDDYLSSNGVKYVGDDRIRLDCVTLDGGAGNDKFWSGTDHTLLIGGDGDDSIVMYGEHAHDSTIFAGNGNDTIYNECEYALIYGEAGNDNVRSINDKYPTINCGAGDDYIDFECHDPIGCVIEYTEGDGNDVVRYSKDVYQGNLINLNILKGNYTVTNDGNDLLVIVGNGSIRFIGMAGKSFNININGTPVTAGNSTYSTTPTTPTNTTPTIPINIESTTTQTTTTPTTQTTPTVTSGNGGGDTIINNYYYYDNSNNNGTIIINSSVEGGVTNNTTVDNSQTIVISGNTWTYNGGNKVINNYQQGEVVALASDYKGIGLNGNSFYVNSSSGSLEIQNARDKFVGYSASGQMAAYSYVASGAGNVDGRNYDKAEIMIGADNANNQIFAGAGGSSMWGGIGGNDSMQGGNGYDEFFYSFGGGDDLIQNANNNDLINLASVNLSKIAGVNVNIGEVTLNFVDGGNLRVQGDSSVGYQISEGTFQVNQSTGQWSNK